MPVFKVVKLVCPNRNNRVNLFLFEKMCLFGHFYYRLGQTTKETSSSIQGLLSRIVQQEEHPIIDLRTPTKTMVSTGTMPRTPIMKSVGTMPRTPAMASTGTMPRTPAMASTGTMPKTPFAAATSSVSTIDIIDLCSPSKPSTADLRSPIVETIDISSSPDTTPTKADSRPPSQ